MTAAGPPTGTGTQRQPAVSVRRARRRGLRRLTVLVLTVLTVAALGYVALGSSLLGVRAVAVQGTTVLTDDEVRRAAAVPAGQPMLRLDTGAIVERVGRLSPVLRVRVERSWSSSVVLPTTERVPVAFEPGPTGARLID